MAVAFLGPMSLSKKPDFPYFNKIEKISTAVTFVAKLAISNLIIGLYNVLLITYTSGWVVASMISESTSCIVDDHPRIPNTGEYNKCFPKVIEKYSKASQDFNDYAEDHRRSTEVKKLAYVN